MPLQDYFINSKPYANHLTILKHEFHKWSKLGLKLHAAMTAILLCEIKKFLNIFVKPSDIPVYCLIGQCMILGG